ncbi:YidC/Oxa1 family membrane protein insertase [Caproiciproducens galactitolivorans]|uniref:Membrane protein insertase YidC n=1 Tax=Caproiciproducens galactitolivorans TaxID=642589 RepID=A0A4Z0YGV8_9FIRM|nr:YidC/Oxa1 family membrane protein insertase [Caproiciproducens galactitolivorans]QEY35195.1 YidC/Oxa1 family membrane protein insertase [Caproiciproducens galactitolivorans]TGJ76886.1 membrane protein insertase YidC [Caproiciproducens galactitolivorans]
MYDFFNFFGNILGYLLWFFYTLIQNYGIAIILFTIVLKILMFPFSIKQQKSLAASSRLAIKQKELQKKYGNDRLKLQQETQKLYEKEGVNPTGGCLTTFIPFPIMIGLFYTVQNPLSNALHLSADGINKAVAMLKMIPGVGANFNAQYAQIEIVKHFADLKPHLTMFSGDELKKIESFSHGFQFLGMNLLDTPSDGANIFGTLFRSNLWVIPVLCLVSSLVTQYFMMKMQPGMQQQEGCMKYMFYFMPLFSAWLACTLPAAVGFYWIISTLTGFLQTLILNIWYSPADLNAKAEAQRIALLEQEEAKMERIPAVSVPAETGKGKAGKNRKPKA